MEDQRVDRKIILRWILGTDVVRMVTGSSSESFQIAGLILAMLKRQILLLELLVSNVHNVLIRDLLHTDRQPLTIAKHLPSIPDT